MATHRSVRRGALFVLFGLLGVVLLGAGLLGTEFFGRAAVAETRAGESDLQKLVVGEWYEVSADGVDAVVDGILVLQTEEWIVVATLNSESYNESRWPSLENALEFWSDTNPFGHELDVEELPLVGKKLVRRKTLYSKAYTWLPRTKIKSAVHVPGAIPIVKAPFKGDVPPKTSAGVVGVRQGAGSVQVYCDCVGVAAAGVTGSLQGEEKKFSGADIQFVRQQVVFDYLKFKEEFEGGR